jgi:hypothetical protein
LPSRRDSDDGRQDMADFVDGRHSRRDAMKFRALPGKPTMWGGQNSTVTSKQWPPACRSASRRVGRRSGGGRDSPFDTRRLRTAIIGDLIPRAPQSLVPYCLCTADLRRIAASCQRDVPKSCSAAALVPTAGEGPGNRTTFAWVPLAPGALLRGFWRGIVKAPSISASRTRGN